MNVILLGSPGAGKGTQAPVLCERLGLKHISTGDIFREEISKQTELGQKVEQLVKAGRLVPDSMVLEIVTNRLKQEKDGLLFDGFPRTLEQAEGLDAFFNKEKRKIDAVVFIDLDEAEVVNRLTARRTCKQCSAVYNLTTSRPKVENVCDKCGGALYQRQDDTAETVKKRLMVYRDQTEPLVAYYKANNKFFRVDGAKPSSEISKIILGYLETEQAGVNG